MWAIVRHSGIVSVLPDHCEIHQQSIHSYNIRKSHSASEIYFSSPTVLFQGKINITSESLQWILRGHPRAKYAKSHICCSNVPHGTWSPYGSCQIIIMSTTNICGSVLWFVLRKNKTKKHALYYLCWTFVSRNNAKRHIPGSVFLLCNVSFCVIRDMNIFAKLLCWHFSYTAAFRGAHAYCCNSNSLVTASINLICLKFLCVFFFSQ